MGGKSKRETCLGGKKTNRVPVFARGEPQPAKISYEKRKEDAKMNQ